MYVKKLFRLFSGNYLFPVIVYSIFGVLWIKLSDTLLLKIVSNTMLLSRLQTWKGWFFILVTSLMLFVLVRNHHLQFIKRLQMQKQLIMNISAPMVLVNDKGVLTSLNRPFVETFGYSSEDIPNIEQWMQKAYPDPEYRALVQSQWFKDTEDEFSVVSTSQERREFIVCDKEGNNHTVDFMIFPQDNGVLVLCRDITNNVKIQEEQVQEDKMRALGQLAGGIAHDFNNHLSAIMGYTDLLMDSLKGKEEIDYLQRIIEAADTSAELTRQLLTFSRKAKTELVPIRLDSLLEEVITLCKHTFPSNIQVFLERTETDAFIAGNQGMLKSMFLNLLINARDSMDNGGAVQIFMEIHQREEEHINGLLLEQGLYYAIRICDQGTGMGEAQIRRIFEPFYTTKTKKMGSGMGLAMVYSTLEIHQGAIMVTSQEGQGSCFNLFLPSL